MNNSKRAKLFSFATECFRDVADKDYIAARVSYRLGLMHQFQWSALQSIEKYLKAILIYNLKPAKGIGHDLNMGLEKVDEIDEFSLDLIDVQREFISRLSQSGQNRYQEDYTCGLKRDLFLLDGTIWNLRKYCKVLNFEKEIDGKVVCLLEPELKMIRSYDLFKNPHQYMIVGGFLESVLCRDYRDILRKALVWKNFCYGARRKKKVKDFQLKVFSHNPPHNRQPDDFELFSDYADFPRRIRNRMP